MNFRRVAGFLFSNISMIYIYASEKAGENCARHLPGHYDEWLSFSSLQCSHNQEEKRSFYSLMWISVILILQQYLKTDLRRHSRAREMVRHHLGRNWRVCIQTGTDITSFIDSSPCSLDSFRFPSLCTFHRSIHALLILPAKSRPFLKPRWMSFVPPQLSMPHCAYHSYRDHELTGLSLPNSSPQLSFSKI